MSNPPTPADLKAAFPSFARTTDGTLQFAIDAAVLRTDAETWGTLQLQGIVYLALHLASIQPEAKAMRKDASGQMDALTSTPWGRERKMLQNIVSSGARVAHRT